MDRRRQAWGLRCQACGGQMRAPNTARTEERKGGKYVTPDGRVIWREMRCVDCGWTCRAKTELVAEHSPIQAGAKLLI